MRPLAGFVVKLNKGVATIKLSSGNKITYDAKGLTYGDEVIVNYNYNTNTVSSIRLTNEPDEGTVKCERCSQTSIDLGEDNIEDIYR